MGEAVAYEFVPLRPAEIMGRSWQIYPFMKQALNRPGQVMSAGHAIELARLDKLAVIEIREKGRVTPSAVAAWELVEYPGMSALRVVVLAGRGAKQWEDGLMQLLEDLRVLHQLDRIESCCRCGFERRLQRHGFKKVAVLLVKE